MPDSGSDDFGGFGATTPNIPRATHTNSKASSSRAQAGPSRSAGGSKNARKVPMKNAEEDSEVDDVQEIVPKRNKDARSRKQREQPEVEAHENSERGEEEEEDHDEIEEILQPQPKARGGSKKPTSRSRGAAPAVNGNNGLTGAAKGKGKAGRSSANPPTSKAKPQDSEPMDVDALDDQMDVEDVEDDVGPSRTSGKSTKAGASDKNNLRGPNRHRPRKDDAQIIARLEEQLSQAKGHINDLQRQLDELCQVRHTEPEQLLERMEAQHQSQTQAQEALVHDLETRLAQHDPLLRKGKTVMFELLTREEADKETQKLQQQVKTYREALGERDKVIKEKDQEIDSLQQDQKALRIELKAEIERSKSLVEKAQRQAPGSASHAHNPGPFLPSNQDPKMTQIIRLYEDLSNIIIPGMKRVPGRYLGTDEWHLNCCYTHNDVTDHTAPSKSLLFSLRLCWDPKSDETEPITDESQLVESVHYLPKDLDKETPEFVESLGFLKDNFTFERNQLSLFVRTLHDYISGEGADDASRHVDDSGSESSVIMVE